MWGGVMIKRIVAFALLQPLFLLVLAGLCIVGGIVAFKSLPIEAFPDVTDIQVAVISLFPGHAAEEVEKQVTIPVEIALSGLPHSVRLFSHTQFGLSFVIATFDDQVNDYFARQQVLERLQGVALPPGVQPALAPLATPIGEIYRFRVQGDSVSPTDLRALQDWVVVRHLKMVPGVADVVSFGGFIKQYQVQPDLAKMHALNIPLQQLFSALGRGNVNAGGSYVEQGAQQYLIRGIGLLRSSNDIGNVVVAERNGTPLLVKDLAQVSVGAVPRQGIVGQDEDDEAVTGIVLMRKGENPSEVLTALKEKVAALNRSVLPKGVQVVSFYDRTWLIHTTLKTVFTNLLEGALLVTCVLYLFLGNVRAAGIVAVWCLYPWARHGQPGCRDATLVNVPFALIGGIFALMVTGIPLSVSAAIGFIALFGQAVLNGVVMVSYFNQLREAGHSPLEAVLQGALVRLRTVMMTALLVMLGLLPMALAQGIGSETQKPLAVVIIGGLLSATLLTLLVLPALYLLFEGRGERPTPPVEHGEEPTSSSTSTVARS